MLAKLAKSANLSHLAAFASATRRVIPLQRWGRVALLVLENRREHEAFARLVAARQHNVGLRRAGVETRGDREPKNRAMVPLEDLPMTVREAMAQRALLAFFVQMLAQDDALLDFQARCFYFDFESNRLFWYPSPTFWRWTPSFIEALRTAYRASFEHDAAGLAAGLGRLGLGHAPDLFVEHLPSGPEPRRIVLGKLLDLLAEAARRSTAAGISLPDDFVALAFQLCTVYELVEALNVGVDARLAFEQARACVAVEPPPPTPATGPRYPAARSGTSTPRALVVASPRHLRPLGGPAVSVRAHAPALVGPDRSKAPSRAPL